jgi:hypothetical protein
VVGGGDGRREGCEKENTKTHFLRKKGRREERSSLIAGLFCYIVGLFCQIVGLFCHKRREVFSFSQREERVERGDRGGRKRGGECERSASCVCMGLCVCCVWVCVCVRGSKGVQA